MSRNRLPFPEHLKEHLKDDADRGSLASVWRLLGVVADPPASAEREDDVDAAWETVRQRAFGDELSDAPPVTRGRRDRSARAPRAGTGPRRRILFGSVALAIILLAIGMTVWWQQPVTVRSASGQQISAQLPDGSTVELNSGTTLRYQRGFAFLPGLDAERRSVELDGEAYFSVTHGDRPFEVRTFNTRVEVLGTEFNVRGRSESGGATEVVVASGSVRVESVAGPRDGSRAGEPGAASVVLAGPGQRSRVTRDVEPPSTVDVSRVLAWRHAGFAVTDLPLVAIANELERRYDLQVHLAPSARARGGSLSLYYSGEVRPETIIHDLCTARGLSYRPISDGYEIYADDPADR